MLISQMVSRHFFAKIVEATAFSAEYVRMRAMQGEFGLNTDSMIQKGQRTDNALRVAREAVAAWRRTRV
jgi:hypothetical protein